jgi:CheY-like chemotaxis protein
MGGGADILVIDDDRDLVNTMRIILESENYQVRTAYNGREGYERIEDKVPDLIILDVMMATVTEGFDFAYKLKNNPDYRHIPILMVTAFPQKMAEEGPDRFQYILGESWPASLFIEKPVDPEELLSSIEELLREKGG